MPQEELSKIQIRISDSSELSFDPADVARISRLRRMMQLSSNYHESMDLVFLFPDTLKTLGTKTREAIFRSTTTANKKGGGGFLKSTVTNDEVHCSEPQWVCLDFYDGLFTVNLASSNNQIIDNKPTNKKAMHREVRRMRWRHQYEENWRYFTPTPTASATAAATTTKENEFIREQLLAEFPFAVPSWLFAARMYRRFRAPPSSSPSSPTLLLRDHCRRCGVAFGGFFSDVQPASCSTCRCRYCPQCVADDGNASGGGGGCCSAAPDEVECKFCVCEKRYGGVSPVESTVALLAAITTAGGNRQAFPQLVADPLVTSSTSLLDRGGSSLLPSSILDPGLYTTPPSQNSRHQQSSLFDISADPLRFDISGRNNNNAQQRQQYCFLPQTLQWLPRLLINAACQHEIEDGAQDYLTYLWDSEQKGEMHFSAVCAALFHKQHLHSNFFNASKAGQLRLAHEFVVALADVAVTVLKNSSSSAQQQKNQELLTHLRWSPAAAAASTSSTCVYHAMGVVVSCRTKGAFHDISNLDRAAIAVHSSFSSPVTAGRVSSPTVEALAKYFSEPPQPHNDDESNNTPSVAAASWPIHALLRAINASNNTGQLLTPEVMYMLVVHTSKTLRQQTPAANTTQQKKVSTTSGCSGNSAVSLRDFKNLLAPLQPACWQAQVHGVLNSGADGSSSSHIKSSRNSYLNSDGFKLRTLRTLVLKFAERGAKFLGKNNTLLSSSSPSSSSSGNKQDAFDAAATFLLRHHHEIPEDADVSGGDAFEQCFRNVGRVDDENPLSGMLREMRRLGWIDHDDTLFDIQQKLAAKLTAIAGWYSSSNSSNSSSDDARRKFELSATISMSFDLPEEAVYAVSSIYLYSLEQAQIYNRLNAALRDKDQQTLNVLEPCYQGLMTFLQKMPKTSCVVFRGQSYRVVQHLDASAPPFELEQFTSTTKNYDMAYRNFLDGNRSGSFLIYICYQAVPISDFSEFADEEEVLLPPTMKMETLHRVPLNHLTVMDQRFDICCLQQVLHHDDDFDAKNNDDDDDDGAGKLQSAEAAALAVAQARSAACVAHGISTDTRVALCLSALRCESQAYKEVQTFFQKPRILNEGTNEVMGLLPTVEGFLTRQDPKHTFLNVKAVAGMGKSMLSIFLNSFVNERHFLDYHSLLVSLPEVGRTLFEPDAVEKHIQRRLKLSTEEMERLRGIKFLLVLDSLDEVALNEWPTDKTIGSSLTFERWPHLRVIITTRGEHLDKYNLSMDVLSGGRGATFGIVPFSEEEVLQLVNIWIPGSGAAEQKCRMRALNEYTGNPPNFQTPFMLYLLAMSTKALLMASSASSPSPSSSPPLPLSSFPAASSSAAATTRSATRSIALGGNDAASPHLVASPGRTPYGIASGNPLQREAGHHATDASSSGRLGGLLAPSSSKPSFSDRTPSTAAAAAAATQNEADSASSSSSSSRRGGAERETFHSPLETHYRAAAELLLNSRRCGGDRSRNDAQRSSSSSSRQEENTANTSRSQHHPLAIAMPNDDDDDISQQGGGGGITHVYELGLRALIVHNCLHHWRNLSAEDLRRTVDDVFHWCQLLACMMLAEDVWKGSIDDFSHLFDDQLKTYFSHDPATMVLLAPMRISGYSASSAFEFRHKSVHEFFVASAVTNACNTRVFDLLRKIDIEKHPNIKLFVSLLPNRGVDLAVVAAGRNGAFTSEAHLEVLLAATQSTASPTSRLVVGSFDNRDAKSKPPLPAATGTLQQQHHQQLIRDAVSRLSHLELHVGRKHHERLYDNLILKSPPPFLEALVLSTDNTIDDAVAIPIISNCGATLRQIDLSRTGISHKTLTTLVEHVKDLRALNLSNMPNQPGFSDALCQLSPDQVHNMKVLRFSKSKGSITDHLMNFFGMHCKHLEILEISHTSSVTDASMNTIAENCRELKIVDVTQTPVGDKKSIETLFATCKGLVRFNANHCRNVSSSVLYNIASRQLLELGFSGANVNNTGVMQIATNAPQLESLDISYTKMTEPAMIHLAESCRRMKNLNISGSPLGDGALVPLMRNPAGLTRFYARGAKNISDKALANVSSRCLRVLDLSLTELISDAGIRAAIEHSSELRVINLQRSGSATHKITEGCLAEIAQFCPKIEHVNVKDVHRSEFWSKASIFKFEKVLCPNARLVHT